MKILRYILTFVNWFFPKNKYKISLWGRQMVNDNTAQILDYLYDNHYDENYKIYCHFANKEKFSSYEKKNIKIVNNKIESMYHMFTSRVIIHAQGLSFMKFKSCRKQIIFDTLHGMGNIDKDGTLIKESLMFSDDYMLCLNKNLAPMIEYQYGITKEKLFIDGNPRNDLLFSNKDAIKIMGFDKFVKNILYVPTYRKSEINGNDCSVDFPLLNEENIQDVDSFLGKLKISLIIKPHPLQNDIPLFKQKYKNIFVLKNDDFLSKNVKLYEFLGKVDALITDISSIAIDYLVVDRPIGYTLDDIDEYKKGRGMVYLNDELVIEQNPDTFEVPGQIINTIEELKLFFTNLINNIDDYKELRKKHNDINNTYFDSNNTKRLLDFLGIVK